VIPAKGQRKCPKQRQVGQPQLTPRPGRQAGASSVDAIDTASTSSSSDSEDQEPQEAQPAQAYKVKTVSVYVAAVVELYHTQVSLGLNNNPNFRGMALKVLLKDLSRKQAQRRREAFEDRGAKGLNSGYTSEQFLHMQDQLLSGANKSPQNLRTRFDALLGHYLLLCGDNRRAAKLSKLSALQYPASEGPTPYWVLVLQSDKSKNN
jgi:hypothetical protein